MTQKEKRKAYIEERLKFQTTVPLESAAALVKNILQRKDARNDLILGPHLLNSHMHEHGYFGFQVDVESYELLRRFFKGEGD